MTKLYVHQTTIVNIHLCLGDTRISAPSNRMDLYLLRDHAKVPVKHAVKETEFGY